MEIRVDISDLNESNAKWWNAMSIDERIEFLDKNGWQDSQWGGYKWSKLHTGLMGWVNRKRQQLQQQQQ